MRLLTVTQIKARWKGRKIKPLQPCPHEGTLIREIYDQLMENLGQPTPLLEKRTKEEGRCIHQALRALELYYGLDIRLIQHGSIYKPCLHSLVGEWFGKIYIDYTAETEEQMDRLAEARYALQHAERVENVLPEGVHHLSKDSAEILERVAAKGRELAEKHLKRGS